MKANEIYQAVTDALIADLESGKANPKGWRKPWASFSGHRNATTQQPYLGFNQLALTMIGHKRGYGAPVWATYKQWQDIGAQVRKGEQGVGLVKWNPPKPCKDHGPDVMCDHCINAKGFPTGFTVFNAEQVDGFTYTPIVRSRLERLEAGERILLGAIEEGLTINELEQGEAFYDPDQDAVCLPSMQSFATIEDYYSTAFHELIHSTGHEKRLNRVRDFGKRFGDQAYGVEELVAELGSAFLCGVTGIEAGSDSARAADYIASWLKVLRADHTAIAHVAGKAQSGATYWVDRQRSMSKEAEAPSAADKPRRHLGPPRVRSNGVSL